MIQKCLVILVTAVTVLLQCTAATVPQECPQNADSLVQMSMPSNRRGFFLSEVPTVECSGTVLAWHFCYFTDGEIDTNSIYSTEFGIYRPSQQWNVKYELVPNTQVRVNRIGNELSLDQPYCDVITLDPSGQFNVIEGDMIGVCVFPTATNNENGDDDCQDECNTESPYRNIIVSAKNTAGYDLEYTSLTCFSTLPSLVYFTTTLLNHALHVSLEVETDTSQSTQSAVSVLESTGSSPPSSSHSHSLPRATATVLIVSGRPPFTNGNMHRSTLLGTTATSSTVSDEPPFTNGNMQSETTATSSIVSGGPPFANGKMQSAVLGIGPILGIAIPLAVLVIVSTIAIVFLCFRRNKHSAPKSLHHFTGTDHFIMVSAVAQPYEEPVPSVMNPIFLSNLQHYEESTKNFRKEKSVPHYEFNSQQNGNPDSEYAALQHFIKNNCQKNIGGGQYSILRKNYYKVLEKAIQNEQAVNSYEQPASSEKELYNQFHRMQLQQIARNEIRITECLGYGQFGMVHQGVWKDPNKATLDVAVKTLGSGASVDNRIKLLQEAAIMGQFLHPNTIQLLGVVISEDLVLLIMELASKGDLKHHLVSMHPNRDQMIIPEAPRILLSFSQQVAFGIHYLANKGFVHRDLAARNILLSDGNVCKIADFGMSRHLANEDYYMSQGGRIPVKWTAPEATHYRKYSTASDVWSYGCLLYEIWSIGKTPFHDFSNIEAIEKLDSGYRLPPPPGCPRAIYQFMIKCWNPNASARIGFREILIEMMEPEEQLLIIPEDALKTHELAGVQGAPIEAGQSMYLELQQAYVTL